jgi:NTE family protein
MAEEKTLLPVDLLTEVKTEEILADLRQYFKNQPLTISDVRDDMGHQYVDLVQEGGGVLGIALVGYVYILEKMGIRFFSLAGTSAGSINAMMLACCGNKEDEKTDKIIEHFLRLKLEVYQIHQKNHTAFYC